MTLNCVISWDRRGNPGGCKIKWGGDLITKITKLEWASWEGLEFSAMKNPAKAAWSLLSSFLHWVVKGCVCVCVCVCVCGGGVISG